MTKLLLKITQDHIRNAFLAMLKLLLRHQLCLEYGLEREAMRDIMSRERGNGDVQVDWIDVGAENTVRDAPVENAAQALDQGIVHPDDLAGLSHMTGLVQVLTSEKAVEFRQFDPNIGCSFDQTTHRGNRIEVAQYEVLLARPNRLIHTFEDRNKQLLLTLEVMINHILVYSRRTGDLVYTSAVQALGREFMQRSIENPLARSWWLRFGFFQRSSLHPLTG
jgi:hypothetical protein